MPELVQVRKKGQLTLPHSIRKEAGVEEGDILDIQAIDGVIVLKAKRLIDKQQAWFWTERWQAGEREAEADIRSGRVLRFKNADDAIASLHAKAAGPSSKPGKRAK